VSITALTQNFGFSPHLDPSKESQSPTPFHHLQSIRQIRQIRGASISTTFDLASGTSLWTAVSITALTQNFGFSPHLDPSKESQSPTPFHHLQSIRQIRQIRGASISTTFDLASGAGLWTAVSITALTQNFGFSPHLDPSKESQSPTPFHHLQSIRQIRQIRQIRGASISTTFDLASGASLWTAVNITALKGPTTRAIVAHSTSGANKEKGFATPLHKPTEEILPARNH